MSRESEPAPPEKPIVPPTKLRVTPFIIGMNVAVFAAMVLRGVSPLQPKSDELLEFGANFGALVVIEQEWWRPLTAMFVHIGVVHLLVNMYSLWNVGGFVERLLGKPLFAAVYLLTGLAGSFASVMWRPSSISAGASGAIFGLFGVVIGFTFRAREQLPPTTVQSLRSSIVATLAFNLLFALSTPFLDHAAHLGGLCVGVLAGVMATASALERPGQRASWGSQAIVLATVVGLGVLAETRTRHRKNLEWELHVQLATAALEARRFDEVVRHATRALEKRDEPLGHELRGQAYIMLGNYEPGIEDLRRGAQEPMSKNNLAWALVRLNANLDEALKLADAAVLAEANAAYLGTRCWVHVARGELDEARRDCESATKLSEEDVMDRGMLKYIEGDFAGAIAIWEQAAKDEPTYAHDLEPWLQRARAQLGAAGASAAGPADAQ